jgi:hypothetical protein
MCTYADIRKYVSPLYIGLGEYWLMSSEKEKRYEKGGRGGKSKKKEERGKN